MKILKVFVLTILLIVCTSAVYSQKKNEFLNKAFFGGSVGLLFGTVTQVDISPFVGYHITDRLSAGIGGTYQYFKDTRPASNFETDIYGGRIFSSFVIVDDVKKILPVNSNGTSLFLHGEVEILSLETRVFDYSHKYPNRSRFNISSYLIGAGLKQKVGERSSINLTVLWNLNELTYSPYSNPVIRVGFSF